MITDHASAAEWLSKGRRKDNRPAPKGSGNALRLVRNDNGSISLTYHQTHIVTYHADGSLVLRHGGWFTKATLRHIQDFTSLPGIRLSITHQSRNGSGDGFTIVTDRSPETAPKVWKCRTCKGTGANRWAVDDYNDGVCRRCAGYGYADYGSAVVPTPWGGDDDLCFAPLPPTPDQDPLFDYDERVLVPVLMPCDDTPEAYCPCKICKCGCGSWQTHQYCGPPTTHITEQDKPADPHYVDGDTVIDTLTALLPHIQDEVKAPCVTPCPSAGVSISVRSLIVHLNDTHRWTREQIADWLDTLSVDLRFPIQEAA